MNKSQNALDKEERTGTVNMGETEELLNLQADKIERTGPIDLGEAEDLLTLHADKIERTGPVDFTCTVL